MIDHLMTFTSEDAAKTDPVVGQYYIPAVIDSPGGWRGDVCLPGVQITITSTGAVYDSNWRIIIALPIQNATLSALSSCHLVTDRDAANAGQPFIRQSILSDTQLSLLTLSPTFAGSNYPFGAPQ